MKIEENHIVFNNGDKVYCFSGTIGLRLGTDRVTYGYDGEYGDYDKALTKEQKIEIAKHMIGAWGQYLKACDLIVEVETNEANRPTD